MQAWTWSFLLVFRRNHRPGALSCQSNMLAYMPVWDSIRINSGVRWMILSTEGCARLPFPVPR